MLWSWKGNDKEKDSLYTFFPRHTIRNKVLVASHLHSHYMFFVEDSG